MWRALYFGWDWCVGTGTGIGDTLLWIMGRGWALVVLVGAGYGARFGGVLLLGVVLVPDGWSNSV